MEDGWSCSSGRLLARHVRGPGLAPHHCNRKESYQQQKSNSGKGLPGLLLEGFEYIMGDSMPAPVSWSHGLQCQSPPPVTHACLPWSFHNFLKGSAISWRPGVTHTSLWRHCMLRPQTVSSTQFAAFLSLGSSHSHYCEHWLWYTPVCDCKH